MRIQRDVARAALLVAACALPASGQRVTGTVAAESTGEPLHAAFVALVDSAGDRVAGTLTATDGRYLLRAPAPGAYRVRVELLGHRTAESDLVAVARDGLVRVDVRVAVEAIPLEGLAVEADSRGCSVAVGQGPVLDRLWREARKALHVVAWAEREELFRYDVETFTRQLSPVSLRVRSERRDTVAGLTVGRPFRTLPPDDLDRDGYVRRGPMGSGRYTYYGPDAEVVLADGFLDRHCLWIEPEPPADQPWIGLGFRPREARRVSDIEGVLWLDRESAELRVLEFHYSPLPPGVPGRHVGGRLEFQRLPSGAWIIRRWWIRTPSGRNGRLTAIDESGAVVLRASTADPSRLATPPADGIISGVVLDSIRAIPLAGSHVYLSGTQHSTTADAAGRFRLAAPPGRYTLSFHHPVLDIRRRYPVPVPVEIGPGDTVRLRLSPPAAAADTAMYLLEPLAVVVEGRSPALAVRGFYARRARRPGRFLTAEQIRRTDGTSVAQLLATTIPGLRRSTHDPTGELAPRSGRGCEPAIYLDGSALSPETAPYLLNALSPRRVEGIEIYASAATVPAEFSGTALAPPGLDGKPVCGAVVIWTRAGG